MQIFLNKNDVLEEVPEKPFKLERPIQKLFEKNLQQLMGLSLVKSEFSIKSGRIDTLAYDDQNKAFIIIEYKREKNISIIDQGFMYLSLMLENKADFVVEYNEQKKKSMKRDEVDWSQSRVVFVAPSFTDVQVQSTNFKDLPIDLWEVGQYENSIVVIKQLSKSKSAASFKTTVIGNSEIKKVAKEVKVITEDDHKQYGDAKTAALYEQFKSAILNLGSGIEVKPTKTYIAFKKNGNIVDIEFQKHALNIWINAPLGTLNDPMGITKDVSKIGHFGNGDYGIVKVKDDEQLEYIMSLIKQVILKH